jgi:DNA-binding PucR family transcriptional regulator
VEALRAQQVALIAGDDGRRVVTYADPGVRTAAMLAADMPGTRQLVASALGGLAQDTDGAARLRETLAVFLAEKSSYVATADRMLLHKNTVKYRVDKAVAQRGRPLDEDRLELELALLACEWLGLGVLPG